ncbi:MAG: response regulator transcription factor [Dehalococcoidia bacterium]|nr:DNA-binding response regulator [Chloroflexi bacterium CFX7]NUQ55656.1 response regulator transcription factor [Dehalococcoidia bacterium]RIL03169.1 MAG: transcriptional regulator [bacterium]
MLVPRSEGSTGRLRSLCLVTRHPDTARIVRPLEHAGFSVSQAIPEDLAGDGTTPPANVIILDFRDVPAAAVSALARAFGEAAVIFALVPDEQLDRVAPDTPVDDFALLSAQPAELARRVERAFWRRHGVDSENFVRCGALSIDLSNYRVTVDGETIVLTFKEYELLRFLAMNGGRVFTREQLLNRVWGYDYFGGARTVDVHIRRIRAKIEIHGHAFIETVRNVGYRLSPDARPEPAG